MRGLTAASVCVALALAAGPTRADQVKLADGGTVEGRVRREGRQIVVELDSGELRFAERDVVEVKLERSALHECDERRSALGRHDVKGRAELARFCDAQGLPLKARALWQEVVRLDPDHAEARAALGYVRDGARWLTHDEAAQKQGKVRYQGQWVDASTMAEVERARADAAVAEQQRKQAEVEREKAEVELAAARQKAAADEATREAERKQAEAQANNSYWGWGGWYGYGGGWGWGTRPGCGGKHGYAGCAQPPGQPAVPPPTPTPYRWPEPAGYALPGVKDPRTY